MYQLAASNRALCAAFGLVACSSRTPTLEDLHLFVESHVTSLLDRSPSRLMSILYRIDVAERDVRAVLQGADRHRIAEELSRLIVARQLQKTATRRNYRNDAGP